MSIISAVKKKVKSAVQAVATTAKKAVSTVTSAAEKAGAKTATVVNKATTAAKSTASKVTTSAEKAGGKTAEAVNKVLGAAEKAGGKTAEAVAPIAEKAKEIAGNINAGIANIPLVTTPSEVRASEEFKQKAAAYKAGETTITGAPVGGTYAQKLAANAQFSAQFLGALGNVPAVGTMPDAASAGVTFGKNTQVVAKTRTWLDKIFSKTITQTITNPATGSTKTRLITSSSKGIAGRVAVAAGSVAALLSTYPWAAHLRVDNVIGGLMIAERDARMRGDTEGAEKAGQALDDVLNPSAWETILNGIPGVNVIKAAKDIYEVARLTREINNQVTDDLVIQKGTGETCAQMYVRKAQERIDQETTQQKADEEYYSNIDRLRKEAKAKERKEDEEYWAGILAKRDEDTKKRQQAEEDYWAAYYKALQKYRDDNSPSNLKFGLL